ncbi:MAG: glycosyltransferase [Candidatus Cloacimonetes bacterium]|jgi:glycosyltransferase involved in cell wall biosynthesis|nr:glycosyltransferase [Candidatus Cloacimonadota bacterium]MCB5278507.1 glycosyltransferase [Candidatus Cloacimonadota bacterium]MDY0298643.1 glycosyltransferase [Candidatus Cloacimonadaceae bacterium]
MMHSLPPRQKDKHLPEPISVIIAARNEAQNLPRLLTSFAQMHPIDAAYEVIIINDHSSDDSMEILNNWEGQFGIRVIDFQDEIEGYIGKKAALQKGIEAAQYDILAFTDADCKPPPGWLAEISELMTPETDYLLGYSTILTKEGESNLTLVNFERSIYYILAAAGLYYKKPITASACNMIYRKSLFKKAGGFGGISHLLSGDDDLQLIKMMPYIRQAYYNPAVKMQVECIEHGSVCKQYHKNIRRASKFRYHPPHVKKLSAFVFFYFVIFYWAIILLLIGKGDFLLLGTVTLKSLVELAISQKHLALVQKTYLGILYFAQIIIFPLQFIFYGIRGTLGNYKWK